MSCCSPCSEHNRNSPFVVLCVFCWAQLILAFCLLDTRIRSWKIFHLKIEAFSKTYEFTEASQIESQHLENDSCCISLPPPSVWTMSINFFDYFGYYLRINFSKPCLFPPPLAKTTLLRPFHDGCDIPWFSDGSEFCARHRAFSSGRLPAFIMLSLRKSAVQLTRI